MKRTENFARLPEWRLTMLLKRHRDWVRRRRWSKEAEEWVALLQTPPPTFPPVEEPISTLEQLRHLLQTRFPVLYRQVLEPTLADLRQEHAAALAEGRRFKARRVLLQGCGALTKAAFCQLGFSFLGRIAALWQARSPK